MSPDDILIAIAQSARAYLEAREELQGELSYSEERLAQALKPR
jgi:hypothetical protein